MHVHCNVNSSFFPHSRGSDTKVHPLSHLSVLGNTFSSLLFLGWNHLNRSRIIFLGLFNNFSGEDSCCQGEAIGLKQNSVSSTVSAWVSPPICHCRVQACHLLFHPFYMILLLVGSIPKIMNVPVPLFLSQTMYKICQCCICCLTESLQFHFWKLLLGFLLNLLHKLLAVLCLSFILERRSRSVKRR